MNTLNTISIRVYLAEMNIHPVKHYGYYGMYYSPLREDRNASFKVDYTKNLWRDFGTNEGGTLIDLIMRMEHCSFHEAASKLEEKYTGMGVDSFSFHGNHQDMQQEQTTTILKVQPITHPALIAFVRERKIDLELANRYCKEIHYRINGRNYFGVGFRNDKDGYELSNPSGFKGCIPPKEVTTVRNERNTCLVFEGFWDFLSYLTLQNVKQTNHDAVILNSVANASKATSFIKSHKNIYTCLDNDEAGRKATQLIKTSCDFVNNWSAQYARYKDLNDYLCQKSKVKPEVKKKSLGFKR
ncbi:DNA primase [termite gut metagenome]|uniref:DNA primase n=1 Tax=termite gut metagenome TaxID=433724 RepID=A0A5J4S3F5_9ZZZZ